MNEKREEIRLNRAKFVTLHTVMEINILSEKQLETLNQLIVNAQNIIICCHKSPDGDALGSSLAWYEFLQSIGKTATVVIPDAFPDFLQWMPNTDKIVRYDKHTDTAGQLLDRADLIFCFDFNSTQRVDSMQQALDRATAQKIMIDHHLDPDMETALMISHPDKSSTSELIFRIIWQNGGFETLNKKGASCIYCGMMTDTGNFTYNSNAPEIFFIISQLLTKGIDKDLIYRNVYNNYSSWAIRMRGYIMYNKLNVLNDIHASFFSISRATMKDFHFIKGDAEGLVNEPLKIKGMKLSISLREDDRRDNMIWVSLRSVGNFPCNKMAAEFFNGGGHLNASGGRLECSLEEAEEKVKQAILHYKDRLI